MLQIDNCRLKYIKINWHAKNVEPQSGCCFRPEGRSRVLEDAIREVLMLRMFNDENVRLV